MKRKLKAICAIISILIGIAILLPICWSLNESNSIRTAVYLSGHPIKAMICHPKFDPNYKTIYTKKPVRTYTLSYKESYTTGDGSYIATIFIVKKNGIFYHAIPKPDLG